MKQITLSLFQRFKPKKLLDSVALMVMALVIVQMISIGIIFSWMIYDIVEQQTEKRALQAARHIALTLPAELKQMVQISDEYGILQPLAESIRLETEATLVIITDRNGMQVSNTDRAQIGTFLVAPEESRALRFGRPYLSKTHNSDGEIISGNAPIFNDTLDIIGMVSVGYLVENVRQVTQVYLQKELFYIWVFITLGLAVAILIAHGVKKATLGLEPKEIANLFQERETLIASIREGIVATDSIGIITLLNNTAQEQFGEARIQQPINSLFPGIDFSPVFSAGQQMINYEIVIQGVNIVFNMVPILRDDVIHGAVLTFRRKDEIDLISHELSQVQAYSNMLRAQTHEYSNRLHAIVGMVQMEAYEEVLDFINEETTGQRRLIRLLTESIPDPIVSSFLIGKYMHALEVKVELRIDPESHMVDIPNDVDRHQLVTILGNVINNAIDAALAGDGPARVNLFLSDYGDDLIFEIEDSGHGVPDNMVETIFQKGVSGKIGENRGYGLHLVKTALHAMNGGISVLRSDLGGALFVIEIPKNKDL